MNHPSPSMHAPNFNPSNTGWQLENALELWDNADGMHMLTGWFAKTNTEVK
ncbi:MAG: hypothetical protein AB2693_30550 [Candidatus Thiodiazotropha sp.]